MQNKFRKLSALALISLFGLTACDDIIAKPSGYDDGKIVNIDGYDEEVYNNMMNIIYDAIHDGSLGSDVLNKVLYQYSLSIFGAYDEAVDKTGITLKAAYEDATRDGSNFAVVNEFILSHKAYWTVNNDGERVDDNGELVANDATPSNSERERVKSRFENIEDRIAKALYNNISGGSYSDRNLFKEENYLMNLRNSLYKVAPLAADKSNVHAPQVLDPQFEDVTVFSHFLNRSNYQDPAHDITYVEDEIVPNIYNEMLVEQYILDNQYNTLGRSYARKVNVVSIKTNEEYPLAARYLVNEFVDKYISGTSARENVQEYYAARLLEDSTYTSDYLDVLKILSNAWKGVTNDGSVLSQSADALIKSVNSDTGVLAKIEYEEGAKYYYEGTEYGDVVEDYLKIDDDPLLTDTSIESSFTNSGAYSKEIGLEIKEREIQLKDHTSTGWYIKNGGLTELPDSIRTRLFNVGVANAIDENSDRFDLEHTTDRWATGTYSKPADEKSYVAKINGSYFLKNNSTESAESIDRDMVFYDSDTSTYYIVEVVEAASTSKLSKINENSYFNTRANDAETFVNEICQKVATNSTYKTLSTKYWLEKAGIKYHDEVVFEYFKDNYPDLFD